MEMPIALEVALFLASTAVVVVVACAVPIAFQLGRSLRHLALMTERLEATAQSLLQDSRELVRNVTGLSERVNLYVEEVEKVIHVVQVWEDRAEQLAKQVGSMVEPPMTSLFRHSKVLQVGASVFLRTLLHLNPRDRSTDPRNPTREERYHV